MGGRAQQQASTGAQHATDLRQPRRCVGDVLDHLPRPHDVEARVLQIPCSLGGDQAQIQLRVARPRAAQRLLGDVDPHHPRARIRQLGGEPSFATADVEHALAGAHAIEQKAPAHGQVGWLESLRQALPKGFVVPAGGHRCSKALISAVPQAKRLVLARDARSGDRMKARGEA